jgi:hypothetical protein
MQLLTLHCLAQTAVRALEALALKRERSIYLWWHPKIPRTRHGYAAERDRT